ncbi:MAG: hypothetical protein IT422_06565, partial [Pirellulaceae bacterium]|nr:hypothetical protein [Pirellulaceae bacterium]
LSPSHKGIDQFLLTVAAFRRLENRDAVDSVVSFSVIGGFVPDGSAERSAQLRVAGVEASPDRWLTSSEYADELSRADLVLQLHAPQLYEARYSSTIYDAICFCVPGVYTATPQTADLSAKGLAFGWAVQSPEEAASAVYHYVAVMSVTDRLALSRGIRETRAYFSVERAGQQLAQGLMLRVQIDRNGADGDC